MDRMGRIIGAKPFRHIFYLKILSILSIPVTEESREGAP
jgi:hypothetical protein